MFSRDQRVTRAELSRWSRRFATLHQPHLALSYILVPGVSSPRLTVSVSKKVARKATDRSTLKRRGRAAAAVVLDTLPRSVVGIIRVKQPAAHEVYQQELATLFQQVTERAA